MRNQNNGDRIPGHVLEIDFYSNRSLTKYIDDVLYLVERTISSPECAFFLRGLYNNEYNIKENSAIEDVFGSVLYRSTEDPYQYTSLDNHIDDYVDLEIKKVFQMSLEDYLNTTHFFKHRLKKKAIDVMEKQSQELDEMRNQTDNTIHGVSNVFDMGEK